MEDTTSKKEKILRFLKFYLIPSWRDPEFNIMEFEIGKIKSKRRKLTRLLTPLTVIGFLIMFFIMFLAVFPQWLTDFTLSEITNRIYPGEFSDPGWILDPSRGIERYHVLGTTQNGIDVHARLIWGARSALTLGIAANVVALVGGVILGVVSAYSGGLIDSIMMRFFDLIIAFPNLILTLIFVRVLGQDIQMILLVYGFLGIPGYARFIRASVLQVKQNIYIDAARTSGANNFRIMFSEILPNAITPIIISFSFGIGGAILGIASLSFIGLGDEAFSDWGTDINWAYSRIITKPWISIFPGLFVAITVLGFMLIGDGIRDALDPKFQR
jgi:ABC-type dipeptide/oligopeptide/nickel transport system permease subunit